MRPPAVGPPPPGLQLRQADESLDRLSLHLWILQKIRGHRATSDDVLLAAFGLESAPDARRMLDLGTGKGTVALLLCGVCPALTAVGVEAEADSADLARRNALLNGLAEVYTPLHGDLRDPAMLTNTEPFDLICGAPPFMPVGTGVLPQNPLRAAGRFELRGGVADYARVAARHLAPGGRVVLLMDGLGRDRLVRAFDAAQLRLQVLCGVGPRPGAAPTFWIGVGSQPAPAPAPSPAGPFATAATAAAIPPGVTESRLDLRPAEGEAWSKPYAALRARLRLP